MYRYCLSTLFVAIMLWPFAGQAEDLLEIFQLALQRDPLYASAQASHKADQEALPQARAQLLPHINVQAAAQTTDVRRASGLQHAHSQREAAWSLSLTQPIIDLGAWDQLRQSEFIVESANLYERQAYQDLILRVSQAYFDVLSVNETLRALQAQKKAANTQLERAKRAFELGGATVTDIYETQARLDLIHANEIQVKTDLQTALDALEKITGSRPTTLAELPYNVRLPEPEPANPSRWTQQAAQSNFIALQALLATKIVQKQIDIAKSEHYPRVDLYAQTGTASNRGIHGPNTQPRSLDSSVGLQLSIPIFSGGGVSSRVREQTSRLQQSRYDYEAAKRQAINEAQLHFANVQSGLAQIKVLEAAKKSSEESLRANQTAYEIGVRDNMDVLDAMQQVYDTQRDLSHARHHTLLSGLYLKASSGLLSEDDVLTINQLLKPVAKASDSSS